MKLAVLGQNWDENSCFRHQKCSSPLDGIDGSKAVDKMLLEVSAKIGEAKSKKELEFFQSHRFWLQPRTWRASKQIYPLSDSNFLESPFFRESEGKYICEATTGNHWLYHWQNRIH